MKRILVIAIMLCAVHFSTLAQQINTREYFYDKDPGPGKGTKLNLSARDTTCANSCIGACIIFGQCVYTYYN